MSKYLTLAILTIVVLAAASCGDSRKDVIREVPVEKVVTREVVKEVPVEKIFEVEKEVVRTVEVEKPVEVIREVVREVEVPGETVVVEKEVVRTVEVVVVAESQASAAPGPTAAPAATPAPQAAAMRDPAARSGATPPATSFQDYQRARFASTVNDAVSTFSLDTDRTSYHLALNWAQSGYEVEPDSVRAEEWINAFDYRYDPPLRNDSFAITTDVFRHPLDGSQHLARIAFQAPEADYEARPLNVTLVLDASGSMSTGNRVDIAREAAESIRRSLRGTDRIAVVHFTTTVLDHLTVEHRAPDDRAVRKSIDQLAPHGSTNVQAGLNLAVKLADRVRRERPNAYNYIILMSDGVANVDATDPFAILESATDGDSSNPLRLITIGVGIENYNDYLLEQLAQHGNGWYGTLPQQHRAGPGDLQPRQLARPVHTLRRPDARTGDLGPRRSRGVAHRRIRKPRHLGRVLHPGTEGVRRDTRGCGDYGLLRAGAQRRGAEGRR